MLYCVVVYSNIQVRYYMISLRISFFLLNYSHWYLNNFSLDVGKKSPFLHLEPNGWIDEWETTEDGKV